MTGLSGSRPQPLPKVPRQLALAAARLRRQTWWASRPPPFSIHVHYTQKAGGLCVGKPGLSQPGRLIWGQIPAARIPAPPNLSRLIGGEPTLPNAQVLGEQVQGKPSSASPRRGRNHRRHLGVEAGARAGKRKFTENQIFFFFNMNKLFFLKGCFVPIFISGYLKKSAIL